MTDRHELRSAVDERGPRSILVREAKGGSNDAEEEYYYNSSKKDVINTTYYDNVDILNSIKDKFLKIENLNYN